MNNIITQTITIALNTIIPIVVGYVAVAVKRLYNKYVDNDIKETIVKNVIYFTEQTCKDLHGEDKLNVAVEKASELFEEKGIHITTNELLTLIESAVGQFNEVFNNTK